MELYADPIEVELEQDRPVLARPVAFTWRGQRHEVAQILGFWHDAGFSRQPRRHRWFERRHRTYYRVRSGDGQVWEIYRDRGDVRRRWFLRRRWEAGETVG